MRNQQGITGLEIAIILAVLVGVAGAIAVVQWLT